MVDVPETQDMGAEEPYSAQVLRRLHEDASILASEYDEMSGPLEHKEIKNHLHEKIAQLVNDLDVIEELMNEHHGELPPIGNKDDEEMPEEEKDMGDEQDTSDSETEEEPTPEDAVEGMNTKQLSYQEMKALRAHWKTFKGNGKALESAGKPKDNSKFGVEGSHKPGKEADKEEAASGHKPEGKKRFKKEFPDEQDENVNVNEPDSNAQDVPPAMKSLEPHERYAAKSAAKFLKHASETPGWSSKHQMEAYHHHKALEAVGKPGDDSDMGVESGDDPGLEADRQEVNSGMDPEGVKALDKPGKPGDDSDMGVEGSHEPGSEADREEGSGEHIKGFMHSILGGGSTNEKSVDISKAKRIMKKAMEAMDAQDEVVNLTEHGEESMHPHRMKCMMASKCLKALSETGEDEFHDGHRADALEHHKALDPIGQQDDVDNVQHPDSNAQDVTPGQMGEKALKKLKDDQIKQRREMIKVNKQIAALYAALK